MTTKNRYFRSRTDSRIQSLAGSLAEDYAKDSAWEPLTAVEGKRLYRQQNAERLTKTLASCSHNGKTTVYSIIRSVSASGMSRVIDLFVIWTPEPGAAPIPLWISYQAAHVLEWKLDANSGIRVAGCGMDMAFHTVYSLERCLPALTVQGIELESRIL